MQAGEQYNINCETKEVPMISGSDNSTIEMLQEKKRHLTLFNHVNNHFSPKQNEKSY